MTKIAALADVSQRTVRRFLDGTDVLPVTRAAIVRAAKELKINLGPLRKEPAA